MHKDFFEFSPSFKLFMIGNHKPALRGVDEAIGRRLHFVPFLVTIPREERDHYLPEKLKAEAPAILRWMIEGCLEWQQQGLNPPEIVRAATKDYLSSEDAFERWREDRTELNPHGSAPIADLWASWKRWAEFTGEPMGTQRTFTDKLAKVQGIQYARGTGGVRKHNGILIRHSAETKVRGDPDDPDGKYS